jgi:hypothetical protein
LEGLKKNQMPDNNKKTHGGTRSGSGAKPKYNEPTTTIAFRCPVSKVDELKKVVNTKLAKWAIKK